MSARVKGCSRFLIAAAVAIVLPQLTGCAATMKLARYSDLDLKTEVSQTIFLEPAARPGPVFLEMRSGSEVQAPLQEQVESLLRAAGYTIVQDPEEASYLIQGNILQVTRRLLDEGETLQEVMMGATVAGAVAGAVTGSLLDAEGMVDEVMLVGGLIGFVADLKTQRPAYTMLTDVRITEIVRPDAGGPRRNVHEIRIESGASKVNLKLEEALPGMASGVAKAIAGILPAGGAPPVRVAG